MPLIRKSASDVTTYTRVNATSVTPVAPNLRSPGSYAYSPRQVISPISRASLAAKGASPSNSVLGTPATPPQPPVPPPSPPVVVGPFGGSLLFDTFYDPSSNPVSSWLKITQTTLSPGAGDFTIAWWQYLSTNLYKASPRVFALGGALEVSFEGEAGNRTFYVYINGGPPHVIGEVTIDNTWAHVAVVHRNGVLTGYVNGVELGSDPISEDITTTGTLFIGARSDEGVDDQELFEGYITNFVWITGAAVYTENFTPPLGNINAVPGTQLLLLANSAGTYLNNSATGGVSINNVGVEWDAAVPT